MSFPVGPGGFVGVGGMFIMRRGIEFRGHETLLCGGQRLRAGEVPETAPRRDGPHKTSLARPGRGQTTIVSHAPEAWSAVESDIEIALCDLRI